MIILGDKLGSRFVLMMKGWEEVTEIGICGFAFQGPKPESLSGHPIN